MVHVFLHQNANKFTNFPLSTLAIFFQTSYTIEERLSGKFIFNQKLIKTSKTYLFVLHEQPLLTDLDSFVFGTNALGFFISISFFAFLRRPFTSLLVLAHEIQEQLGPQRLPFWKQTQYNLRHLVLEHLHTNF